MIEKYIVDGSLSILVKPSSPISKVIGWDESKKALRVAIKAVPDKDKANKEVVKFFSKMLVKKVEIIKGMRSREKVLRVL